MTRRVVIVVLVAAVLGLGLGVGPRLLGVSPYRVTSGSMLPTIAVGQYVVVTDVDDDERAEIAPGDVVLFHYPLGTTGLAIKRVAAVGGDTVAFDEHSVTVDGDRRAISGSPLTGADARKPASTVPDGEVFLLGDNAAGSIDSRSFGAVPDDEVVGLVRFGLPPIGRLVAAVVTVVILGAVLGLLAPRLRRQRVAAGS